VLARVAIAPVLGTAVVGIMLLALVWDLWLT
jgi:hypothetical protein